MNAGTVDIQDPSVASQNYAGRLNYPTFLYLGFGAGYWIYQDNSPGARLTGIAPLMEVHVNQALQESDVICFGNYQLGDELGVNSLVNGLVGLNFEWGKRSTLTFAYATPIGGGSDRWLDGELRAGSTGGSARRPGSPGFSYEESEPLPGRGIRSSAGGNAASGQFPEQREFRRFSSSVTADMPKK